MQNVGIQTQGFTERVCVCMPASLCTCGKEGVFSLFMKFNTCYIDLWDKHLCVYQQNPQQFDLVVMQ